MGETEQCVGAFYEKKRQIYECRRTLWKGLRGAEFTPADEIERFMVAQELLQGIKERLLEIRGVFDELLSPEMDMEHPDLESAVLKKVGEINPPVLLEEANARLIPKGFQGKPEFAYGGLAVHHNRYDLHFVYAICKDKEGNFGIEQNQ